MWIAATKMDGHKDAMVTQIDDCDKEDAMATKEMDGHKDVKRRCDSHKEEQRRWMTMGMKKMD